MARQRLSSDKAEEQFDGSSGISLMVLIKVSGDVCSDCSVGSYLAHYVGSADTHRGGFGVGSTCTPSWDFLMRTSLGSLPLLETL